ncbi:MAG: hypothetical protein IT580_01470 [Verrucomicrobiales bacterium]|nr:hypothetical protein [Verrucomicrobiales bacterium]
MRWLTVLLFAAVALLAPSVPAQSLGIEIDITLDEKTFLPGEAIPVGVRITNLSGRTVTFGSSPTWLNFYVETKSGDVLTRLDQVPVEGEFSLDSAKVGTKWWNIQPHFDISQPGSYRVYAEVRLPDWNQRLVSEPVSLSIEPTRTLWDVSFGVPPANGDHNAEPEIRRYSLLSATRNQERKLFARVADESETKIHKVVLLDRLVSFAKPEQQLDNASRLHVLFQIGGNAYTYCVLDPAGNLVIRERHDIASGVRPRLAKADDGSISVRGGGRFPTSQDIPPYTPPPPSAKAAAAAAAAPAAAPATANGGAKEKKSRAERREERRLRKEKDARETMPR